MTTTDHTKTLKQIQNKPGTMAKYRKYNVPKTRPNSELNHKCVRCGRTGGHISKYGLHVCRQCFREIATKIGFKKFN
ncbi:MAG: 30S ribosomal protein S14 [Candidatus Woesearchaeota archaeon]